MADKYTSTEFPSRLHVIITNLTIYLESQARNEKEKDLVKGNDNEKDVKKKKVMEEEKVKEKEGLERDQEEKAGPSKKVINFFLVPPPPSYIPHKET